MELASHLPQALWAVENGGTEHLGALLTSAQITEATERPNEAKIWQLSFL